MGSLKLENVFLSISRLKETFFANFFNGTKNILCDIRFQSRKFRIIHFKELFDDLKYSTQLNLLLKLQSRQLAL